MMEKLSLKFDIEKLKNYYFENVIKLPGITQGGVWTAWGIQSENGDYRDGLFATGDYALKALPNGEMILDREKTPSWKPPEVYTNYTQLGTEYVKEVIEGIRDFGLNPFRSRWARLKTQSNTAWHRDEVEENYRVFLHIPIITHPTCFFIESDRAGHMVADGSCYLMGANKMHQGINPSFIDKVYILMDVTDDNNITKHYSRRYYEENKYKQIGATNNMPFTVKHITKFPTNMSDEECSARIKDILQNGVVHEKTEIVQANVDMRQEAMNRGDLLARGTVVPPNNREIHTIGVWKSKAAFTKHFNLPEIKTYFKLLEDDGHIIETEFVNEKPSTQK